MQALLTIVTKVAVMLIMIAVGYLVTKRGMFTERGASEVTSLLIKIVTPCLIVSSFLSAGDDLKPMEIDVYKRQLLALCDKRGALAKSEKEKADYNRQNILACPAVHRKSLPVFLAVLNNKKPVRPSDMGEYVVSSKYLEPYSAITRLTSKGMLRRVDTPRTFVDKNGRIQNTSYEATVDYMDFFLSLIHI